MSRHETIMESTPESLPPVFAKGTASPNGNIFWSGEGETISERYDNIVSAHSTESVFKGTVLTASSKRFFAIRSAKVLEQEKFENERDAFLKLKDSLLDHETYTNKFVAIHQGRIVDVGEDKRELARNVYDRFGYIPIYIGKVERVRRIIEMPSPEGP